MKPLSITYVHEPPRVVPDPYPIRPERYDQFINAVGRSARCRVRRVRGFLKDLVLGEGFILLNTRVHPGLALDECAPAARAGLAARMIPIELTQGTICESVLEPLSLAGGIDSLSLFDWDLSQWAPAVRPGARGLYGLRDVGLRVGAACELLESPRYGYFTSARHSGLPDLLVDYLRELASVRARTQNGVEAYAQRE